MIYSASQLIGKTILLLKTVNVYSVFDLNNDGDKAKPIGTKQRGGTFLVDSFLDATTGYTSVYGITYAPRQVPYFTFYDGTSYNAIAIIADGRFSTDALGQQGALTVKEEVAAAKKAEEAGTFQGFMNSIFGDGNTFKKIEGFVILIVVVILLINFAPVIAQGLKKK
jgi:hypothetical protein